MPKLKAMMSRIDMGAWTLTITNDVCQTQRERLSPTALTRTTEGRGRLLLSTGDAKLEKRDSGGDKSVWGTGSQQAGEARAKTATVECSSRYTR